jgi:SAM-dependent methyltransferase
MPSVRMPPDFGIRHFAGPTLSISMSRFYLDLTALDSIATLARIVSPGRILEVAFAYEGARALQAAVELGVFAALGRAERTAPELARRLGTNARATELLCNALVPLGFLRKRSRRYSLAPIARAYLVPSARHYLGDFVRFGARRWVDWERLAEAVRTGEPPRVTNYFQESPEELETLLRGMDNLAFGRGDATLVARKISLRGRETLIDIGGGPGSYAIELCRRNPGLRATLFDLPATLAVARGFVRRAKMRGRIQLRQGDYRRDPLGGPYDVALLFNILHGEDEVTNEALLRKVHAALRPGGLLLIKDHVLDESRTSPADGAIFSLVMLLFTRGRSYARGEIRGWLRSAGFGRIQELAPEPPMTSAVLMASKN